MTLVIETDLTPLAVDADGIVRVDGTRVTLDSVMEAFDDGATPDEIAARYPALSIADIYSVIAYYLRHQDQVRAYLERERDLDQQARQEHVERQKREGIRERLLARLDKDEQ